MTKFEEKLLNIKKELLIVKNQNDADLITHNGTFHSDEIFATVVLSKVIKKNKIKICRTSDELSNSNAIVYDVGFGKYDHHQLGGNGMRENGIKYSSFGLVWKEFGKEYLKNIECEYIDDIWEKIDKKLVQNIDANDNGQIGKLVQYDFEIITLPNIISLYNSNWDDEEENQDNNFINAVEFAENIFNKLIISANSKAKAKKYVERAIEKSKNKILILDKFMPWKEFLLEAKNEMAKDILYVIFPSNRGGYNICSVPKDIGTFESKKLLPQNWAGLKDKELQDASNIKTAIFCHPQRFICSANSLEDAIKMAEIAIKED